MRIKNNTMALILSIFFIITCFMFFYQNIYLKNETDASGLIMYIAKKDILAGDEFNSENIGAMKTNKLPENYMLSFKDDLKGKKAKTNLYKNEIINKERIDIESNDTGKMFSIKVKINQATSLQKNDIVRLYVQIYNKNEQKVSIFELFDKQITDISVSKTSKTTVVDGFYILVSDEEAINYYNATKFGEIITLKFNDIEEENKMKITKFDSNSPELEDLGIDFSAIYKVYDPISIIGLDGPKSTISYVVKKEDTWQSIATLYGTTENQLKLDNINVDNLSEGQILTISY